MELQRIMAFRYFFINIFIQYHRAIEISANYEREGYMV